MSYITCSRKHKIFEWKSTICDSVWAIKHQPFQKHIANYCAVIFFEIEKNSRILKKEKYWTVVQTLVHWLFNVLSNRSHHRCFVADQMWLSSAHIFQHLTSLLTGALSKSMFGFLVLPAPEMNILHLLTITASAGLYSITEHLPAIKCCLANQTLLWDFCKQYIHSPTLNSH